MSTASRRERISKIISEREISKQDELVNILNSEGYSVTQATVSRDFNELNVIKVKGNTVKTKYALPEKSSTAISDEKIIVLLKTLIISVDYAENLVVIKTLAGNGSACGMAIDKLSPEGVIGSIAGDDTLLIVAKTHEYAINTVKFIKNLLQL